MTALFGVFAVFFIGGPLFFRVLTKPPSSRGRLRVLSGIVGALALSGFGLRYGLAGLWGRDMVVTIGAILALWFAWIAVLALGAQALRQAEPGLKMRRWSGILGAAGTTVPWFGLASARMLAG